MPIQLPYQVTVHIDSVDLNRNFEDKFLPIDAINIQILSDLIELKSKAVRARELLESEKEEEEKKLSDAKKEEEKSLKIEDEVSNLDLEPSTSQRTSTDDPQNDEENSPKIVSSKISFNLIQSKSDRVFNKKISQIASGILSKHESVIIERNIKDFGSGGFSLTSSPETLADWLDRKPFRYDIIKDGEMIGKKIFLTT